MIYSQNCYDSLTREFTWAKLDRCGAFDLLSVRSLDAEADTPTSESSYFASEAAAGRYLAAATKAGEKPENADVRLEDLQKRISNIRAVKPVTATPDQSVAPEGANDADSAITGDV